MNFHVERWSETYIMGLIIESQIANCRHGLRPILSANSIVALREFKTRPDIAAIDNKLSLEITFLLITLCMRLIAFILNHLQIEIFILNG